MTLKNILSILGVAGVFLAIGYYLGATGLLAGGAAVAAIASRVTKRNTKISALSDKASDEIDSSIKRTQANLKNIESMAEEAEADAYNERLSNQFDGDLHVTRPDLGARTGLLAGREGANPSDTLPD